MPVGGGGAGRCVGQCSEDVTAYMLILPYDDNGGDQGSPINASAQKTRVEAGRQLYGDNACSLCHKDDGSTTVLQGESTVYSLHNCPSCARYDELVAAIGGTMPKGDDGEFGPASCSGDCAKKIADYIWVEYLDGTLTTKGGTLPKVAPVPGKNTLRIKSYESLKAHFSRVFGGENQTLEDSENAFKTIPDFWYIEHELGAVSLNIVANAAVEGCNSLVTQAASGNAEIRANCATWAESMWLRSATQDELNSCVNTATTITDQLNTALKRQQFACASMMMSIPALTF